MLSVSDPIFRANLPARILWNVWIQTDEIVIGRKYAGSLALDFIEIKVVIDSSRKLGALPHHIIKLYTRTKIKWYFPHTRHAIRI